MPDHPVLGQVALGYSPIIDRQRGVSALRLTVFPQHPDLSPDGASLLRALEAVWPAPADTKGATRPQLSLNLTSEGLLHDVLAASPGSNIQVEVPAFMAGDSRHLPALKAIVAGGGTLALKGRPLAPLTADVLACFSQYILGPGEDRRDLVSAASDARTIGSLQSDVTSALATDDAFRRGHLGVMGWPWDDPAVPSGKRVALPSDISMVMELISGVDREDPVARLEPVLRRDPTLAFRLLRYLNSPAFGLPVEVNSFGHAVMLLGYQRLKRWLALLLVSSAKGPNSKVLVYAAVRRGLLMEELGRDQGLAADSNEFRGEMFICGIFSLLDRLMQQPMADLLRSVPVPERVQQALRGDGGLYGPYLDLVQAIELASVSDIREKSEHLLLSTGSVSRAVLAALSAARDLDY